jgi:hypothetical protein
MCAERSRRRASTRALAGLRPLVSGPAAEVAA